MKKKGISLIVLIITVVVIVILVTAIVVNFVQNNVIDAGKKATFLNNYTTVKEAVNLYVYDEIASTGKINGLTYPTGEILSNYQKDEITEKVPTLATTILALNPGKSLDDVELYYIDEEKISLSEQMKEKKPSGYLIDISNGQIYDYAGEYFYKKRWHVPEEGYNEKDAVINEEEEKEIWDGWIKLNLYYPDGATNKMWRLHEEGQVRGLPDNEYDTWIDYTGSITIPLARVQDVYIKYTLNGKVVVVPPEGVLAVDINVQPATEATESVTVDINYDTRAEVKEYKVGNSGWQEYVGPFEVTGNVMIEARATMQEKIYDSEGNLQGIKKSSGKDAYQITNIVRKLEPSLAAPKIEFVDTVVENEIARLKITYPEVAVNKVYTINYGKEKTYTEEISITERGKVITAYYYTNEDKMSKHASVYIDEDGELGDVVVTIPKYPQAGDPPITPEEPEMNIPGPTIVHAPTDVTTSVDVTLTNVPSDAQNVYIKVGTNSYEKYTGKVTLTSNQVVYAYYIDKDGYRSNTSVKRIKNIRLDSKLPYVAINATPDPSITNKKVKSVEVTISSKDAENVEYSFDGVKFIKYEGAFNVTRNCTVYARATNEYGVSEDYIYITNISGEPPKQVKQLMVSILANPEPTLSTNKTNEVEITINYDSKATQKYYRIGNGENKEYTESFKVTENCVIYAYAISTDANGVTTMKGETEKVIDNLSTGLSEPIITANPTNEFTNDSTRLTIKYDVNATSKKYKIDDDVEINYTTPFEVEENCKITAIARDNLGNEKITTYIVTNIVKPTIVTIDKGSYYIIKLNYPTIAKNREYKYRENGEWKEYKDEGFIFVKPEYKDDLLNAKGELIVKIEDEKGNMVKYTGDVYVLDGSISEIFENIYMRWDRSKPDAPIITPSTTDPTRELYIAIQYSDKLDKKQYKISYQDGKTTEWMPYKGLIEVKENNTVIYARGQDSAEMWTDISSHVVNNIDTIQPEISLEGDFEKITNCLKLKVNAKDAYGIKNVKYAPGVLGASAFKTTGTAITNGATINITEKGYYTFYAIDNAGNEQVVTINITNIDIVAPNVEITTNYIDGLNAKVTISYEDSIKNEYKIGTKGTWQTYESELTINSYDIINKKLFDDDYTVTIYARGRDDIGNQGEAETVIDKIDLQLPEAPVINSTGAEYPTLTEYGIVLDGAITITYPENVKKLYSLDGENWQEYTGEIKSDAIKVYAKAVKESGLEVSVEGSKKVATDALGVKAYDSDINSYEKLLNNSDKYLLVESNVWNKKINSKYYFSSQMGIYFKFYDSNGEILDEKGKSNTSSESGTMELTIPEGTVKLGISYKRWNTFDDARIYDLTLATVPVINETKYYPEVTEYGVKVGYNEVTIDYFQTSVQRLYRINDREWKEYQDKAIRLEIGDIIEAKGIDKYGKETKVYSYTAILPDDSLGVEAYDSDINSYEKLLNNSDKYLLVESNVWNKKINSKYYFSSQMGIYFKFYDSNGEILDEKGKSNTSSESGTMELTIPEGTVKLGISYKRWNTFDDARIYDLSLYTDPVINQIINYPILSISGVNVEYNKVRIEYNLTSVQRLYRINQGNWQNYNNEPIQVQIGDEIEAKGIDKLGNETKVISYTVPEVNYAMTSVVWDNDENTAMVTYGKTCAMIIDEELIGEKINIKGYRSGSTSYIKILDKDDKELYSYDPGYVTNYSLDITIPTGAYKICSVGGDSYTKIKEITYSKRPSFNFNAGIHALITAEKIGVIDTPYTIKYSKLSKQKLYKINDEKWKTYNGEEIRLEDSDVLYAKAVFEDGTESESSRTNNSVSLGEEIGDNAYDGDETTFYLAGNAATRYIYVDSSAWNKQLRILSKGYQIIQFKAEGGTVLHKKSDFRTTDNTYKIPEGTAYIEYYFNESGGIYEMMFVE